MDKIQESQ